MRETLERYMEKLPGNAVMVAFSGGVDSGLLLAAALPVLVLMHAAGAREALSSIRRLLPVVILLYLFMRGAVQALFLPKIMRRIGR